MGEERSWTRGELLRRAALGGAGLSVVDVGARAADELSVDSFSLPITTYARAHFLTTRAAAPHMIAQKSGVILMHTPEPARLGIPLLGDPVPRGRSGRRSAETSPDARPLGEGGC
jgi:NAD(P)-dependent dehydrogenase (short-subunit alcohol dehydrogenase family)